MVPLKYLSNFWRTLEISLTNCEITLDLKRSGNCVILATNITDQVTTFSITDTKFYAPFVTLSTQDNAKLLDENQNLVLKKHLIGINIKENYQQKDKINI